MTQDTTTTLPLAATAGAAWDFATNVEFQSSAPVVPCSAYKLLRSLFGAYTVPSGPTAGGATNWLGACIDHITLPLVANNAYIVLSFEPTKTRPAGESAGDATTAAPVWNAHLALPSAFSAYTLASVEEKKMEPSAAIAGGVHTFPAEDDHRTLTLGPTGPTCADCPLWLPSRPY